VSSLNPTIYYFKRKDVSKSAVVRTIATELFVYMELHTQEMSRSGEQGSNEVYSNESTGAFDLDLPLYK
jgi:pantothenate synthetase